MKIGTFAVAAGALALGLAVWSTPGQAQGPLFDRVNVNLPYTVTIGDHTLQPGDYVIQQMRDQGGNSRVLLIYSDNGMKFQTSAMTIPALDQNTPSDTKVMLHHFGQDYYFDKIWIQGKNYGYEFPLPDSVKSRERERMQPISVAATYQTVPASEANNTTTTAAAGSTSTTASSATTNNQTTTPATTNSHTTTPAATGSQTASAANPSSTMTQQDTSAASNPTTARSTASAQTTMPPSTSTGTADRSMNDQGTTASPATTRSTMPATSAGWVMMLLGGGALSGAGLKLRRRR